MNGPTVRAGDHYDVVDCSFMPSIGAVNPTLTIITNALRVADRITERIQYRAAPSLRARQRRSFASPPLRDEEQRPDPLRGSLRRSGRAHHL